jgi:hypothetical protein
LTGEQKEMLASMAGELLRVISVQREGQWHDIITLDKLWVELRSDHDLIWMAPGKIVPDRGRQTIQSPEDMLTVASNRSGFCDLKCLTQRANATSNPVQMISWWHSHIGDDWMGECGRISCGSGRRAFTLGL